MKNENVVTTELSEHVYEPVLKIDTIITTYYFEFSKNYHFSGEKHDFWEIVYVDKGSVQITTHSGSKLYSQGSLIFHEPNEFHKIGSDGVNAANVLVITFNSKSKCLTFFNKLAFLSNNQERIIIQKYLEAVHNSYHRLGYLNLKNNQKPNNQYYCNLMYNHLIELLLYILQTKLYNTENNYHNFIEVNFESDSINNIIKYMKSKINSKLTLKQICNHFYTSESDLKKAFKFETGVSIMHYYKLLKIDYSKQLIREGNLSYTEIANLLAYDSVHHFSKAFKNSTHLSPSAYKKSINKIETQMLIR